MLNPKPLMELGYAFPCAYCEEMKVFHGIAPACLVENCGGPFVGRSFPSYKGPLTRTTLATHCFRCGGVAREAIVIKDGGFIGVCEAHLNSTVPTSADTLVPDD